MFVLSGDNNLEPLRAMRFEAEADFQALLENYPTLLSGELIDPERPRSWILIAREMPVPSELDGSGVWSADHLFLDQDGIPTIVEVKRQSDTHLRREVVAQMLDYAANAAAYWNIGSLQELLRNSCQAKGVDSDQELRARFGDDLDLQGYWERVKTNLEAGKLRLLFVADYIPRELRIIVEFLNRQMNPAEVLALELKQYGGESGIRTIAPTLFGQTERARAAKNGLQPRQWDANVFFDVLEKRTNEQSALAGRALLDWLNTNAPWKTNFGRGKENGTISAFISINGVKLTMLQVYTYGKVYFTFTEIKKPPFDGVSKRRDLLNKLNSVGPFMFTEDCIDKQPSASLDVFASEAVMQRLQDVLLWFAEEALKGSSQRASA